MDNADWFPDFKRLQVHTQGASATLRVGGTAGAVGNAALTVTGGIFTAGELAIVASGAPDAVTGDAQGGTASLTMVGSLDARRGPVRLQPVWKAA